MSMVVCVCLYVQFQVNNMVAMLSKKLKYLQSSATGTSSMQLETLAIQLQVRVKVLYHIDQIYKADAT